VHGGCCRSSTTCKLGVQSNVCYARSTESKTPSRFSTVQRHHTAALPTTQHRKLPCTDTYHCLSFCLQVDGHLAGDIIIGYYDRTNFADSSSVSNSVGYDDLPQLDNTAMLSEAPLTSHLLQLQQQQLSNSSGEIKLLALQPPQQQQQQQQQQQVPPQLQHRLTDVQLATALLQRSLSVAISDLDGLAYRDSPRDDVDTDVSSSESDNSDSKTGSKSAAGTAATAKQQCDALLRSPSQQQIQQQLQRSQRSVHSSTRSDSQSPKLQNINNRSRRRRHRHEALHTSADACVVNTIGSTSAVATQQLEDLPLDVSSSDVVGAEQLALAEQTAAAARRDAAVKACAAAYNRGGMSGADFIEQLGAALVSTTLMQCVTCSAY
jgi:hypothetical protein